MINILLTSGTGFIGTPLGKKLSGLGYSSAESSKILFNS